MFKRLIIIISYLFALSLQSQEVVLSFKNEELSRRITKDSYTILNAENNNLALIIIERKDAVVYLFDSEFKELVTFDTPHIKSKYNGALGYSISGNVYSVLYANNTRKKLAFHHIDFNSKTSSVSEIELLLNDDEIFLDAMTYNNSLYILSGNNSSALSLQRLNKTNEFEKLKTFNLEEISEHTSLISSKIAVGSFLFAGSKTSNITKIDPRAPTSIERASNANKLYQNNETIYLTFDNNEEATILYTINLDQLNLSVSTYNYPKARLNDAFKKFNSFIFQDNIYQIASSNDEMAFEIKDFNGKVLKDFYINRDRPINFKNSPIIQEGVTALPFVTKRKLEQTSKYLRKISSGNPGINVQKVEGLYQITLGGYQVVNSGGATPMVSSPEMATNGFVSYNPTYLSYSSYSVTKSTYFNTILNSEFNHIKGKIKPNTFDRVSKYKQNQKYSSAEDIFYINNTLYFGYFNLKESEYNLVKF
jgi:hypothetical protein